MFDLISDTMEWLNVSFYDNYRLVVPIIGEIVFAILVFFGYCLANNNEQAYIYAFYSIIVALIVVVIMADGIDDYVKANYEICEAEIGNIEYHSSSAPNIIIEKEIKLCKKRSFKNQPFSEPFIVE